MITLRPIVTLLSALLLLSGSCLYAAEKTLQPYSGPALPDFQLNDLAGKPHRLSDYRGRVVLVNFWATWCTPCRQEMPSLQRLQQQLADRPFTVLAVNASDMRENIDKYLQATPLEFTILLDSDAALQQSWLVKGLPASYIIDATGTIRYVLFGRLEWDNPDAVAKIKALLP